MDSNLLNKVSQVIEIEDDVTEIIDDVIDLDGAENTPEEVIYEWDAKIRHKLSMFSVADNENVLGNLMKEYLESLQEMTRIYEDNETLKNKVFCHVSFLYSYYVELQCCAPDNYLSSMEDILTLYCNLVLEVIRPLKKKDFSAHKYKKRMVSVSKQIIHVLTVFLLGHHDHILHVLIKVNTNSVSNSCSEVLNILYSHFLTKVPAFNLSDESFCRNYIVFQKWKHIRKSEDWEGMDKIMYKMFKRSPESIRDNETLRQILMPACETAVDIVLNLYRSFRDISNAYFKHISAKKTIDLDDLDFDIDLGEDEPTIAIDDENEEEVIFLKAYCEVERDMSNLLHSNSSADVPQIDTYRKCKQELDEDDDVQFVSITVLPKQPSVDITVDDDEKNGFRISSITEECQMEEEMLVVPSSPLLLNSSREKAGNLDDIIEITRIAVSSPRTVVETPVSLQSPQIQTTIEQSESEVSSSLKEMSSNCAISSETNQPKVSLVSTDTLVSTPSSPVKINDTRTTEMKNIEVQAGSVKNCVYNDYGLTTPPFEVSTDEQITRSAEPRLYTDIGQNRKKDLTPERENVSHTRSVEVQVDPPSNSKNCPYNDYGLTPPNETHVDDHTTRVQETCLYTNIVQNKDKINAHSVEVPVNDAAPNSNEREIDSNEVLSVTKNKVSFQESAVENTEEEHESECESESQVDSSEITHIDAEYDLGETSEECSHESHKDTPQEEVETSNCTEASEHSTKQNIGNLEIGPSPDLQIPPESSHKPNDQIDTGQTSILNTAPNIEPATSVDTSENKDLPPETFNGNTVLKPLLSSNRTNGQAKDVSGTAPKIVYTSTQKIRTSSLDDFSRFESAIQSQWNNQMKENQDFDQVLSGPVSKIVPTKHNLVNSQDKLDIFASQEPNSNLLTNSNSRSNSPNDMISPVYEGIDDFRNYFSDSVNGRVPPPHDAVVPQGILKKTNSTRKKNCRIMFHESTCDNNSEERRPRSDGVLVLKQVRRDRLLNMEPRVVVERLSFLENSMKVVLHNPPTLRVDYDKTTRHLNAKDVVRCISPPKFSWILNFSGNRLNPGKVKSCADVKCKKDPPLCAKNQSSCCKQLVEEFTKLNCNVTEETALNLTIPDLCTPVDPETEFSNSPTFLQDPDELVQLCLEETTLETPAPEVIERNGSLLCENSNFYKSLTGNDDVSQNLANSTSNTIQCDEDQSGIKNDPSAESGLNLNETVDDTLLKLPTAVPETYDFEKNLKNEVFSKIDWQNLDDSDGETRLPLKKRKLSVANQNEEEPKKEEISYPATPMISIAEVEALHPMKLQNNNSRTFKTPAERKEMPPLPVFYNVESEPSPIITDQFNINNHTYNNPTINYHMNNVPVPFINIPCGSYYSLPPILVPFNNMSTFEQSKINTQQQETYVKKENRKQGRQRRRH